MKCVLCGQLWPLRTEIPNPHCDCIDKTTCAGMMQARDRCIAEMAKQLDEARRSLLDVTSDNDRLTKAERALEEIGRTTGCNHTGDPDGQMQLVNCVQQTIDELHRQVNALIESCYYRTAGGKVHWKQGQFYGTSTADNTDPAAFEQAMAAIRRNAGIGEVELPELPEGTYFRDDLDGGRLVEKPTSKVAMEIAARVWCDREMKNCVMDVEAAKRIARIVDEVRREQCDELGYQGLAESGGLQNAP